MLAQERITLSQYAYTQTKRLKKLHYAFAKKVTYPRDVRFKSAIYDLEDVKIFSLLEKEHIHFDKDIYMSETHLYYTQSLSDFYLGAKYLIIEVKDEGIWRSEIWKSLFLYGFVLFFLLTLFGLYLAKIFLKPMRDSIVLLDRFIKDTTHELNTPLSAILANIEMMDTSVMTQKNKKKLNRINIAAKTVSVLYRDLTYLTLEQEKEDKNEEIALLELIEHRVEYFTILAQSKNIKFILELEAVSIVMDRRKLTRLIDNLLSNAIKYNKRNGHIGIKIAQGLLIVWDTGIGISEEKIPYMFDRYIRFNESEGGFGVGLSIVKSIINSYGMRIEVKSTVGEGTKMVLTW